MPPAALRWAVLRCVFGGLHPAFFEMRWLFDVDRSVSMSEINSTIELLGYTLVASFQNVNHRKNELINVPRVVMGILTSKYTFFLLPSSFFLSF